MARGTINGNKINVTGFPNPASTDHEHIYQVQLAGISNATGTDGETIKSNFAVIKQEKRALITVIGGGGISPSTLCGSMTISTKNIKKNSLSIAQFPDFINTQSIKYVSGDTYILEYCVYPNYGSSAENGIFILGGIDIYGHGVYSDEISITNSGGAAVGSLTLFGDNSVPYYTTESPLWLEKINCSGDVEIIVVSGNVTGKTVDGNNVSIKYPANTSRNYENVYKVKARGYNIYGDVVESDVFVITQGMAEQSSQFYLTGDDISYSTTRATFTINYSPNIDISTARVVSHSSTIINYTIAGSRVTVETNQNNTTNRKELSISVSATTDDGRGVYADGLIYQDAGFWLTVPTGPKVSYYAQTHSFTYSSFNVNGITASGDAAFVAANGRAVINTTTKNVSLTFNRNTDNEIKTFAITLKGRSNGGSVVEATYTFKQDKFGVGEFLLTALEGFTDSTQTSGTVAYDTEQFKLRISYPFENGYDRIGICIKTSTSDRYKIYNTEMQDAGEGKKTLVCDISPNGGNMDCMYVVQVSGVTPDNQVQYTNVFEILHKANVVTPILRFNNTDGGYVDSSATTKTQIAFTIQNVSYVFVSECTASDGAAVISDNLVYGSTSGSFSISFPSYPVVERVIRVDLSGIDTVGNPVQCEAKYVLRQRASGLPGISVSPNPVELTGNTPEEFTYIVNYVNVSPQLPIYDDEAFSSVGYQEGENTGFIVKTNNLLLEKEYTITFTGKKLTDGSSLWVELKVIQPGRLLGPKIVISSDETILENGAYIIAPAGGYYPLNLETDDIDISTLEAFVDNPIATAYIATQKIEFSRLDTTSTPTEERALPGEIIDDNTLLVPAGNTASFYFPDRFTVTKDDQSRLVDDTYIYNIELQPDEDGSYVMDVATVYVTGRSLNGDYVESVSKVNPNQRHITFIQRGEKSIDVGGEYQMHTSRNIVPDVWNYEMCTGNEPTVFMDYKCKDAGFGSYWVLYAEDKNKISAHQDEEIDPATWGVYKKWRGRGGYTTANFSVSDTFDSSKEFWIRRTRSTNSTFSGSNLTVYGYAFSNNVKNDREDYMDLYISAKTINGNEVGPVKMRYYGKNAYIRWAHLMWPQKDQEPNIIPASGGSGACYFYYRQIDESTIRVTSHSEYLHNISFTLEGSGPYDLHADGLTRVLKVSFDLDARDAADPNYDIKLFLAADSVWDGSACTVEANIAQEGLSS